MVNGNFKKETEKKEKSMLRGLLLCFIMMITMSSSLNLIIIPKVMLLSPTFIGINQYLQY